MNGPNPTHGDDVILLTPVALEADSRTLRQAWSLAGAGLRPVVIEGVGSGNPPAGPFTLLSARSAVQAAGALRSRERTQRAFRQWRLGAFGTVLDCLAILPFVWRYAADQWRVLRCAVPHGALYILHSYYYYPAMCWLARRHAWRSPSRFIYDAHDFYAELLATDAKTPRQRWQAKLLLWIERCCMRHAAAIMTVSPQLVSLIAQRYGRSPALVRNLHDCRLDRPVSRSIRNATGVTADDFLFVCIGNHKPGMAVQPLLDALALFPDRVHVAFLGRGYDAVAAEIAASVVSGRVHLLPAAPPDQVVPLIAAADAAIIIYQPLNRNYEGALPNGLFQALAAGLPLLYPDLPAIRATVEPCGSGILFDPLSSTSTAAAIRRLMADQAEYARLRRSAQAAAQRYSWADEERHFLALVERALVRALAVSADARIAAE